MFASAVQSHPQRVATIWGSLRKHGNFQCVRLGKIQGKITLITGQFKTKCLHNIVGHLERNVILECAVRDVGLICVVNDVVLNSVVSDVIPICVASEEAM